jgi:hypothetical protein
VTTYFAPATASRISVVSWTEKGWPWRVAMRRANSALILQARRVQIHHPDLFDWDAIRSAQNNPPRSSGV